MVMTPVYCNLSNMQRVLVTGVNGFVGAHLGRELKANGIEVVGIGGPLANIAGNATTEDYRMADLNDPAVVHSLDFANLDAVIHLAGLAAVGPSFERPLDYITNNIGMEINLFEAALAQQVHPRFLIISSGSLYDNRADLPLGEQSAVIPSSPYAVSKIGQEEMAHYYALRGFEVIVVRPFNHIGPGQNLGFLVPDLVKQIVDAERGATQQILVGNLDAKRDYTDVRDIARAYRLLIDKGVSGETYNVCSGRSLSGHEILEALLGLSTGSPEVVRDPSKMRPSDSPDIYGDCQKIKQTVNWQPTITLETTLKDTLEDWRQRT